MTVDCPLSATQNFVTADCAPEPGFAPTNATIDSITQHADGTFTMVLVRTATMDANDTLTITYQAPTRHLPGTYQARMRATYTGTGPAGGPDLTGRPVAEGNSFTNTASVDGNSAALPGPNPTLPPTQTSEGGSIDNQIASRAVPMDCGSATYGDPTAAPDTPPVFQLGDRVCFRLRVNFAPDNPTRNVVVVTFHPAFIPRGTRYEPGSQTVTSATTCRSSRSPSNEGLAAASLADPRWLLGQEDGAGGESSGGSPRFVGMLPPQNPTSTRHRPRAATRLAASAFAVSVGGREVRPCAESQSHCARGAAGRPTGLLGRG